MHIPNKAKLKSRKFIIAYVIIFLAIGVGYILWQKYKYPLVGNEINSAVSKQTDKLYSITYDSLYFDEVLGDAFLKNIRITADTARLKNMAYADLPSVIVDLKISSIRVSGVKTVGALSGESLVGDSLTIDQPEIVLYTLKAFDKQTKIETEATSVYEDILGKLSFIKAKYVFINEVNVVSKNFYTKRKNYALFNAKIKIDDLLIDSTHDEASDRVLFSKQAAVVADSFLTYNQERRELIVKDINFSGMHKSLMFKEIELNRFENDSSDGLILLKAKELSLSGINSNEVVKKKNIIVDTIFCSNIEFFQPPQINLETGSGTKKEVNDSTGFMNVYSIDLKHIGFPKVRFYPAKKSSMVLGNMSIKVNDIKANKIGKVKDSPLKYSKEVAVGLSSMNLKSKDNHYEFALAGLEVNSLHRSFRINSFKIIPYKPEMAFAAAQKYQADRYDLTMNDLVFKDIVMEDVLKKRLIASRLDIGSTTAKIYRDLRKPLEQKSKVGNYPSQLLDKLEMNINIQKLALNNAFIEYKERQENTDSTGVIAFANSSITISNVTNLPEAVKRNNEMNIAFRSNILRQIPISGNFIFTLNNKEGKFRANDQTGDFDAEILNEVTIPMALIKIKSGRINSLDFNFTGNNTGAKGKMVMKYNNLKVDILKRDKNTKDIKKRGLVSLVANVVLKNDNPLIGELREVYPEFERNEYKSFFNLVWKTVFKGMKETVGMP
ncbi:MAG: hypothetical protein ABIN48_05565 [Ginsengibacter sp.]